MCNNLDFFTSVNRDQISSVTVANGKELEAQGVGECLFKTKTSDGDINEIRLEKVLYVPELESNLISVNKITSKGCTVIFENNKCLVKKDEYIVLEGISNNSLYRVDVFHDSETVNVAFQCKNENCIELWHND